MGLVLGVYETIWGVFWEVSNRNIKAINKKHVGQLGRKDRTNLFYVLLNRPK